MDKYRSRGDNAETRAFTKEAAGKLTGHERLVAEGRLQKQAGRIQQTVGVVRDTSRSR
jgi:uncharacterized protein YjbJ (UPF0337 family)